MPESRRTLLTKLLAFPFAMGTLATAAFARIPSAGATDGSQASEYRSLGRNILRFINTAQAWHNIGIGNGLYIDVKELIHSETMDRLRSKLADHPQLGTTLQNNLLFQEREIVPGWKLDFKVSDDRLGYVAVLTDVSGKMMGSLSTDERGIIYEGTPLDTAQLLENNTRRLTDAQNAVPLEIAMTYPTRTTFRVKIRELLKNVAGIPDYICPCYAICGGEKICCYPCCNSCVSQCNLGSGCSCCVNVGCQSCVWCCGI